MLPEPLSPRDWLERQPLMQGEQLFAIFSNASSAEPLKAWQNGGRIQAPRPIWADTVYAEWEPVMPYVAIVDPDGDFMAWVANTESRDWGWLAVSAASPDALVAHLCSLTQVLLPNGNPMFFRFWDGRFLLPILQSADVDTAQLMPMIERCLINGQPLGMGSGPLKAARDFPWWEVPETLLQALAGESDITRVGNLLNWLSEERPDLFEAFSEPVLRHKIAAFLRTPDLPDAPKAALVEFFMAELS